MNDLPRPWNYILLIAICYAVLAAAEWHLARKAGPNWRRISWPQRLAMYGFVTLMNVLVIEAPQWTMWGGIAIGLALIPLLAALLAVIYYYVSSANRILVEADRLANEGQIPAAIALLEQHVDRQISRDRSFGGAILVNIAVLYGKQKQWPAADSAVERAMELLPNDPIVFETKASLLRDRGQTQEARRVIEAVLPLCSKSAPLLTTYAEILIDGAEWDWAQKTIDQVEALLDSKEFVGVQSPAEWRTVRLAPLKLAIQRREPVFPAP